ncbi:MAG: hypothetical protein AAF567_09335 [Actinomycetota bacterium]
MESTPQRSTRRFGALPFTRRSAAIVVALLMIAAPAGASVIVQNYMEAEVSAVAPCFAKTVGADPDPVGTPGALITYDGTGNTTTVDGVDLIEERITLTGMVGDRVIYTDVVNYVNNCTDPITVQLTSTGVSGDWSDFSAEIWISNVANPANIDPNQDPALTDDWNDTLLFVGDPFVAGSTGSVVVAPGASVQGAFVVSTDVAIAGGTTATVNWVAEATLS